jgi:hypothetical protein
LDGGMLRRARSLWETDDLLTDANWTAHGSSCHGPWRVRSNGEKSDCPLAWLGADSADPPNPDVGARFPAEMYNVDGANYESVNIFFMAIFRGFGGGGDRVTGELNELHLGFSRDGFQAYRPLPRRAFMAPSWPEASWHHTNVQSVGGGVVLADEDTLRIYASSRSGLPHTGLHHSPGGNRTMGFATIRRDGWASVTDSGECGKRTNASNHYVIAEPQPGELLTRRLIFEPHLTHLFVNAEIARGGFLTVELVDEGEPEAVCFFTRPCVIILILIFHTKPNRGCENDLTAYG